MALYLLHVQVLVFGRVETRNILCVTHKLHYPRASSRSAIALHNTMKANPARNALGFGSQVNYCQQFEENLAERVSLNVCIYLPCAVLLTHTCEGHRCTEVDP